MKERSRVVVGMSGGVDSSVSLWLLKEQGYDVIGLFMKNWDETDEQGHCTASDDFEDVRRVCSQLNVPYYSINFEEKYWDKVFQHFLEEYKKGRTPNPDILCNQYIKFGDFKHRAKELGARYIATGHYAQIKEIDGEKVLLRGADPNKDQSYFLYAVNRRDLLQTLFPIGHLQKEDVRKTALQLGLSTAQKKDSTGICFIGEKKFRQFLQNYLPATKGEIRTLNEKKLGTHEGVMYYTIGQRQGLGIGGTKEAKDPWFVSKKDVKNNILYVVEGHDHPKLYSHGLIAEKVNWLIEAAPTNTFECTAKFRYRQPDQDVIVSPLKNGHLQVEFKKPQRAITPGQSVVFYEKDVCLGGGVIEKILE